MMCSCSLLSGMPTCEKCKAECEKDPLYGVYPMLIKDPIEANFDALSAAIVQVNSIRFSPIHIIRHFNIFSLDKIEKELGMPQGYLSKAIKNKRALPKEWEAALKKYLLNLANDINEKMA